MTVNLSYPAKEVYRYERADFFRCLFVPESIRETFFSLYALNGELARIPAMVSEEMIGHIRYAWWDEALEALYDKGEARGHPLLEALKENAVPKALAVRLMNAYREAYPDPPTPVVEEISTALVQELCPQAGPAWAKAGRIIARNGKKSTGWLSLKLLIAGLF